MTEYSSKTRGLTSLPPMTRPKQETILPRPGLEQRTPSPRPTQDTSSQEGY